MAMLAVALVLWVSCGCIACLQDLGSTENWLLIYIMVMKDATQRNEDNQLREMAY